MWMGTIYNTPEHRKACVCSIYLLCHAPQVLFISLSSCASSKLFYSMCCVALFSACTAPPRLLLPPPLIVQTCNINFSKIIEFQRKLRYPPSLVYQHPAWVDAMFGYSAATVSGGHGNNNTHSIARFLSTFVLGKNYGAFFRYNLQLGRRFLLNFTIRKSIRSGCWHDNKSQQWIFMFFFKKKSICYLDDDTIRGLWWYLFCSILFWCTMDAMHGIEKTKLGDNINIKWPTICITRALSISCFEHGWCPKIFITICLWS